MRKSNVEKLQIMAQNFLQYRYRMWLCFGKRDADWAHYEGACDMIVAIGGDWKRHYSGDHSEEAKADIKNYSHTVWFPDDDACRRLNLNVWNE